MEHNLQILLIEDSDDDAILITHVIKRGGLIADIIRVQNEHELKDNLAIQEWDIIITDNELPGFNAERAISIIKEFSIELPIIIVSGNISEEQIVRFMRAGVQDYISKSNFTRLVPSIEREIQDYRTRLERNEAQNALKDAQLSVHALIETTTDAAAILKPDGEIITANAVLANRFDMDLSEFVGKNIFELMYEPEIIEQKKEKYWSFVQKNQLVTELDYRNGRWIENSIFPIVNEENHLIRVVVFSKDITEKKLVQDDLVLQKAFLQKLFDDAPVAIAIIDNDWVINKVNKQFEALFEFSPKELLGKRIGTLLLSKEKNHEAEEIAKVLSDGLPVVKETQRLTKSGNLKDVVFAGKPIFVNDNKIAIYAMYLDITERKQAEREIIRLNESLEKKVEERTFELNSTLASLQETNTELSILNEAFVFESQRLLRLNDKLAVSEYNLKESLAAKDRIISIIGHDLKNPLQALLLSSDLLKLYSDKMTEEQMRAEHIKIAESANNLSQLLNDLLEWALVKSDQVLFRPEFVDIYDLVHQVIQLLANSAERKGIVLQNRTDSNLKVFCDRNMIITVLRNLITNSIKFSNTNSVVVIETYMEQEFVGVAVSDSGVGISPQNLERLFKLEETYSSEGTAHEKGSGLGLVICKEFIEKHKGRLYAKSELGVGSTFCFELPI